MFRRKFVTLRTIMKYQTSILPSGLRVVLLQSESPVVWCGYQVAAGTRHEMPGEEGMAHLCEHMTFKGTSRHTALQIANALELVGGELNAFTTKEDTTFYAAIGANHLRRAVDVLTDMVFASTYPQPELDREIEVVCDEIESYNDSPSELIFDEFENLLFENQPLGHNVLGQSEQLRSYRHDSLLAFAKRHYKPQNAVFFAYGNVDFGRLESLLNAAISSAGLSGGKDSRISQLANGANGSNGSHGANLSSPPHSGETIAISRGTHQAHIIIGTRAFSYEHPLHTTLALLNNLLGGPAMNARLNQSLRERNGLVYTVEGISVSYTDTGVWGVYFGCDDADINRCLKLVRRELDRLIDKPISAAQLAAAKQQMKGQVLIAGDNREQAALDFGKLYLHYGELRSREQMLERIDAVSAADIRQVAEELFAPQRLVTLMYR